MPRNLNDVLEEILREDNFAVMQAGEELVMVRKNEDKVERLPYSLLQHGERGFQEFAFGTDDISSIDMAGYIIEVDPFIEIPDIQRLNLFDDVDSELISSRWSRSIFELIRDYVESDAYNKSVHFPAGKRMLEGDDALSYLDGLLKKPGSYVAVKDGRSERGYALVTKSEENIYTMLFFDASGTLKEKCFMSPDEGSSIKLRLDGKKIVAEIYSNLAQGDTTTIPKLSDYFTQLQSLMRLYFDKRHAPA